MKALIPIDLSAVNIKNSFRAAKWPLLCAIVVLIQLDQLCAQTRAFPTAEGFGAFARGGRGGDVYHVTNLNDDGTGSLRYGIENATGPRTIVFDVSGTIKLESKLTIKKPYITIAGQTAPGDGICLRDYQFGISADHIVVRYIRSRLGDQAGQESDAISITSGKNIMVDHCSAGWSVDEVLSCSTAEKDKIDSVTVQWCMISEALENSIHSKGAHSYGALIRGCYGAKYSYHHNLFAHNRSRNPRPGNYDENSHTEDTLGLQLDFRNNVIYNWGGSRPGYDGDSESVCRYNYVGNYGKPGPNSNPTGYAYSAGCKHFRAYFSDNHFFGEIPADPWMLVTFSGSWTDGEKSAYKQSEPFSTGPMVTESAQEAYSRIMAEVGASFARDAVDTRVIHEVRNGTGAIIDSQSEVGGWPTLHALPAPTDTDQDGMPDDWETENGLDPNDPNDRNGDRDFDGYTNLEAYLNSLEPPAYYELSITGGTGYGSYVEGTRVGISANAPNEGYVFDQWKGDTEHVAEVHAEHTTVTMPAADISLIAVYKEVITGQADHDLREGEIFCYPNPTDGSFFIDLRVIDHSSVEIYNLHGKKVHHVAVGKGAQVIKDHHLVPGIYLVKIKGDSKIRRAQKLMIR
jgi:hypothetical protein